MLSRQIDIVPLEELYNDEAERTLLGIQLVDNSKILPIGCKITVEDYFTQAHKLIQGGITELNRRNKPVDIVSVSEYLRFNGELETAGSRDYITQLAQDVITVSNYDYYCNVVLKYSKKRKLITLSDNLKEELSTPSKDVDDIASKYKLELEDIMLNRSADCLTELLDGLEGTVDQVSHIISSGDNLLGYSTGFSQLDYYLSGLCPGRLYIIGARPSLGKGLSLDCNILTPTGWVRNRDLSLGDKVIGRDGKPTTVVGIYPQPLQKCYRITFKDGRAITCDAPHEWTVKYRNRIATHTTEELYQKLQCVRYQRRISIPSFTGDYGVEKDFIIPPYIMGVLIGDGCLTRALCYCKPSKRVFDRVKSFIPEGTEIKYQPNSKMVKIYKWYEALKYIKEAGLATQCYNKFIPQEYFHSSKEQREQLFQGLMDTDGHYRGKDSYEYSTTSKQLAKDVQQLAWSLGYNCKITERMGRYKKDGVAKETRVNYRVSITKSKPLTIVSIEEAEPIPTQCIHVDNEDKLFVIEDYLVTHNSALSMQIAQNVSKERNVVFASLEMSTTDYVQRMVFGATGITQESLSRGFYNKDTIFDDIYGASKDIADLKLYVIDDSNANLSTIENGIVSCIAKYGSCDCLFVDYLQLMSSSNPKEREPYKIVSANSTGLKKLARKYNIPVVALCQLSRSVEQRQDKRPLLSDLRESGAIEQDADCVIFLYRDEVYDPTPMNRGLAEFIVAKNRQGRTGTINMVFEANRTRFKEAL